MAAAALFITPAVADLKKSGIAGSKEAFHAKFRRGLQVERSGGNSVYVSFGCGCRYKAGGINFKIPPVYEEISCFLEYGSSCCQSICLTGKIPVHLL
jgi:hypothetical protein